MGNLDERVSEANLWELMTQMGPVYNVHMPMDRVSRMHQGYGFIEFDTPESADYAAKVLNGIRLHQKPIRVNKASADKQKPTDIGAELFINNLDQQVDEKILFDTFSQFGTLVSPPTVIRDQNNVSKGYGFVSYDSFEASDAAKETMNGQYLLSKQITAEYAYKKDGKGERHGDEAERTLAAEGKKHNVVPEQQPLPPAFLMSAPPSTPAPGGPYGDRGMAPSGPSPVSSMAPPGLAPPMIPATAATGGHGLPPRFDPGHGRQPLPPQMPPAGFGRGAGILLPAAPGLPARPPAPSIGFNGPPGDFHPGRPGAPPGQAAPGFGMAPPPGFGAVPSNGTPPPPPSFMPPPTGFGGPPPVQTPPGFGRR